VVKMGDVKDTFSKEYDISKGTEAEKIEKPIAEVVTELRKNIEKEYGLNKPKRIIIRGKIIHD